MLFIDINICCLNYSSSCSYISSMCFDIPRQRLGIFMVYEYRISIELEIPIELEMVFIPMLLNIVQYLTHTFYLLLHILLVMAQKQMVFSSANSSKLTIIIGLYLFFYTSISYYYSIFPQATLVMYLMYPVCLWSCKICHVWCAYIVFSYFTLSTLL